MTEVAVRTRRAAVALFLVLVSAVTAAAPVETRSQQADDATAEPPLMLDPEWSKPGGADTQGARPPVPTPDTMVAPLAALSRGRWPVACGSATQILAQRIPDIDALGVFALCAALGGDEQAAMAALVRLREVERSPHFAALAEGVRHLKAGRRDEAAARFAAVLRDRAGDPLALYFRGETLHLAGEDAQAVAAFEESLIAWPEHTPAMTAAARLLSKPQATERELLAARTLAERATKVDPWSQAHWRLLADLCRRTGESDRAEAIALQWLRTPLPTR